MQPLWRENASNVILAFSRCLRAAFNTMGTMPLWRAHPIRFAALLGAIFGFLYVAVLELNGVIHGSHNAVIPMLIPIPGAGHPGVMKTVLILFVEVIANILVWALLFALPVSLAVGIRRSIRGLRRR